MSILNPPHPLRGPVRLGNCRPTRPRSVGREHRPQAPGPHPEQNQHPHPTAASSQEPPATQAEQQQPAGSTQHTGGTQPTDSAAQHPPTEWEDTPDEKGGRAMPQRPYHEGRGDQRMRGKRFKAAVQAAFAQRGWHKSEEETWKSVAHLVGMDEDDEEDPDLNRRGSKALPNRSTLRGY